MGSALPRSLQGYEGQKPGCVCVPVSWLAFHMWEFASGTAASRESGAENQSGSWHGQAPTIPASIKKEGKSYSYRLSHQSK